MDEWGRLQLDFEAIEYGVHVPVAFETDTVCLGPGDENNLGVNCKITARPLFDCDGDRKGATLVGPVCGPAYVCRSCGCNAHNAMCNRHGARAPPCHEDFADFIAELKSMQYEVACTYAMHFALYGDDWADRWTLSKRQAISESQCLDGISPERVKIMVKREVGQNKPTKARGIQFYWNLATQAQFAPETASLQKTWCAVFSRRSVGKCRITFSSGMNANQLGCWMDEVLSDYVNPHFYERDGKNWDATMCEKHQQIKYEAYQCAGPEYLDFARRATVVKGFGKFKNAGILKYKLAFTTKSGHNDTTLGNNLVNAAITWTAFRDRECDILIAGDDLLVVVEGDFDEHAIAEVERRCGIKPEYRKFYNVEDTSYISGLFANTPQGIKFIAKPGRLLNLLFWSVHPPSMKPRQLRGYQRGVAKGVMPTMGCVPVVGPWLAAIGDEGFTIKDRSRRSYTYGSTVEADFSGWFSRRYGLSGERTRDLERILVSHCTDRVIIRHPDLDYILNRDLVDIADREVIQNE